MKRTIMTACMALLVVMAATAQERVTLPQPNKKVKMTLFDALQQRASVREYAAKPVSDRVLSQLLWAACGVNRRGSAASQGFGAGNTDIRITAPSAINAQDITVYVCREDGAWRYDARAHALEKVSSKDLREAVADRQPFAKEAPVSLVLVSDVSKVRNHSEFGAMDAGYVSENICLACTALGLATVPRASMDKDVLARELGLGPSEQLMLNNPVGYPK
ncbi:MAG: SagB/ThcOx family dehydrogenase [Prevotella sp.]|nr:SagB/ThcOx family dehydrogenase [Prevotella sp.]